MYMINTISETVREAALMPTICVKHLSAPLPVIGSWPTSAFDMVDSPAFGLLVTAYARVRDVQPAAPPRGSLC